MATRRIGRRLLVALEKMPDSQQEIVMVKLYRHDPAFAQLPMSNDRGNARALAFAAHVEALLLRADPGRTQASVVQRAANVCVFVVQAPAGVIKRLLAQPEVETAHVVPPSGGCSSRCSCADPA